MELFRRVEINLAGEERVGIRVLNAFADIRFELLLTLKHFCRDGTENGRVDRDPVILHFRERFDKGRFKFGRKFLKRRRFQQTIAQDRRGVEGNEDQIDRALRDRFRVETIERNALLPDPQRASDIEELDVEICRSDV